MKMLSQFYRKFKITLYFWCIPFKPMTILPRYLCISGPDSSSVLSKESLDISSPVWIRMSFDSSEKVSSCCSLWSSIKRSDETASAWNVAKSESTTYAFLSSSLFAISYETHLQVQVFCYLVSILPVWPIINEF